MTGLIFSICSFFNILLLIAVFFSKKRLKSIENNLFVSLLLVSFFGVIFEILCYFATRNINMNSILSMIILRTYLIFILTWVVVFTAYVFIVSRKSRYKNEVLLKSYFKKVFIGCSIFYVTVFGFIWVAPLYIFSDNNISYSHGMAVDAMFLITIFCSVVWLILLFSNFKEIKDKKYLPIFIFIVMGIVGSYVQSKQPGIILSGFLESFVTFIMFFTIENPDLKLINELNIARDQADKANSAKTEFLSSMSHEIRTPLNAIVGFSQSLYEQEISDNIKEDVKDIVMASESLLDIVNGILDISKIEANKLEIIKTEYSFKKVFDELVTLTKGRLGEKPLEFNYKMDESIPPVLYGDYVRVKQVILNILTNAIKYTNEGRVDFNVNTVIKEDVCRLIISVEDTGIGIKKEKIDKLFQKFERVNEEEHISIEGTGLGLAITKKLVELMDGNIVVQSEYGKGSKFTVALDQRIVSTPACELQNTVQIDMTDLNIGNKRILIVDDNKINLKVASRLLQGYNVDTLEVSSGQECIDLINTNEKFDLIFMDDMMPKMSGIETFEILKKIDGFNIPTVALTANAISGMKEKYLSAGFDDYLPKPIDRQDLNRIIKKFLDK